MKRRKRKDLPPEEGGSCFVVGTVGRIKYYEPMPPGGSRVKYVRGQGIVFVEKIPVSDGRGKATETVTA